MLVVLGYADGLVSGSVNSTANTVRPALQVIKTKPGQKLVSGAFLMCFKDHVAVFSDCAINLNPECVGTTGCYRVIPGRNFFSIPARSHTERTVDKLQIPVHLIVEDHGLHNRIRDRIFFIC